MNHAVHYSIGKDGEYIHNSWYKLTQQGFYNDFKTTREWLLLNRYVRPLCFIIY
jgi:hypothetical protein